MFTAPASVNIISPDVEAVLFKPSARHYLRRADDLHAVQRILSSLPPAKTPINLDLIGHSTNGHHLLRIGNTVINMLDPAVADFFRHLADSDLLEHLNVTAVRLLGCSTATTPSGRRTMRMLSAELGLPVYGTTKMLLRGHFTTQGYNQHFSHLLSDGALI
ncbi:hypothetical protein ABT272_45310 [Streptomyces sp900105245]|uniref:DUF4347 domain-containing protein n=1 Tax=Streptomyces sp. 900105245 TaxID=3154379 RepID=A0ABV1UNA2_9ACTN